MAEQVRVGVTMNEVDVGASGTWLDVSSGCSVGRAGRGSQEAAAL